MLNSKSITKKVSDIEKSLIETCRRLKFGTIYGLEVLQEEQNRTINLTVEESQLIEFVRENQYIDVLTVHAGRPAIAETDFVDNGFRCRKKIKFPTEWTEG